MFAQSRDTVRSHFLNVWRKMAAKAPLQPMELGPVYLLSPPLLLAYVAWLHCASSALLDHKQGLSSEGDKR